MLQQTPSIGYYQETAFLLALTLEEKIFPCPQMKSWPSASHITFFSHSQITASPVDNCPAPDKNPNLKLASTSDFNFFSTSGISCSWALTVRQRVMSFLSSHQCVSLFPTLLFVFFCQDQIEEKRLGERDVSCWLVHLSLRVGCSGGRWTVVDTVMDNPLLPLNWHEQQLSFRWPL